MEELEPREFLLPHQLDKAHMRKSEEIHQCDCHLTFSHTALFCLAGLFTCALKFNNSESTGQKTLTYFNQLNKMGLSEGSVGKESVI